MHRAAVHANAGLQRAVVRIQALKERQQSGMNIENLAFVVIDKDGRQNAHEAGKHHHVGIVLVDDLNHGAFEVFTGLESLVIDHGRFDAHFLGSFKSGRIGTVGKNKRNADALSSPIFPFTGLSNRHEIRATARDQNYDVFHECKCARLFLQDRVSIYLSN